MATYEVTLRDVADRVDKLAERIDSLAAHFNDRMDGLSSQLADLKNDVVGLRAEWRLAKWALAVFGAPAWAAVVYVIVRDLSSTA